MVDVQIFGGIQVIDWRSGTDPFVRNACYTVAGLCFQPYRLPRATFRAVYCYGNSIWFAVLPLAESFDIVRN